MTALAPFDVTLLDVPDDQLGLHAYAWWAVAQAEKCGLSQDQLTPEIAESIRVNLLSLSTDVEDLAGLERALQIVAGGDPARGGRMFREHLKRQAVAIATRDEALTGRRRQAANARRPRVNELQQLIMSILDERPTLTADGVLQELREHEHGSVIESINDSESEIEWLRADGRVQSTPFSAIKDRVSRAKKRIRSR